MSLSRWEEGWRTGLVFPAVDLGFEAPLCREGCDHQRLQVLWQLTISIPYYDPWSNSTGVHVSSLNGILDTSASFGLQYAFEQLCSIKKNQINFFIRWWDKLLFSYKLWECQKHAAPTCCASHSSNHHSKSERKRVSWRWVAPLWS